MTTPLQTMFLLLALPGSIPEPANAANRTAGALSIGVGVALTISNPGFETDFADPGCFALFTPTGWDAFDPNGILGGGDFLGALDPTGSTFFPSGAPEGINVALVFLDGDIGGGPVGVTQVLGDTLQPNTAYTLTVQVGDIASGQGPPPCDTAGFFNLAGFPGYQVQLLAGGVVLAQDNNTLAATLTDGAFDLSTVSVTIGSAHPQLGQALEVRLINLNTVGTLAEPGIEVDFDDVMLFAEPVADIPATSQWGLLVMVLIIMTAGTVVLRKPYPSQ